MSIVWWTSRESTYDLPGDCLGSDLTRNKMHPGSLLHDLRMKIVFYYTVKSVADMKGLQGSGRYQTTTVF